VSIIFFKHCRVGLSEWMPDRVAIQAFQHT
jgi:hypothetical protein